MLCYFMMILLTKTVLLGSSPGVIPEHFGLLNVRPAIAIFLESACASVPSCSSIVQDVAMHFHSACGFALVVQLYLLPHAQAGAYYGHQQLAQQNHPLPQLPHMPLGKEGIPQQQYLGKELPHLPYGNDMPMLPYYGNEQPQMPFPLANPNLGKGMNIVNNINHILEYSGLMCCCHLCHRVNC